MSSSKYLVLEYVEGISYQKKGRETFIKIILLLAVILLYPLVFSYFPLAISRVYFDQERSTYHHGNQIFSRSIDVPSLPWFMKAVLEVTIWTERDWRKRICEISLSDQLLTRTEVSYTKNNTLVFDVTDIASQFSGSELPILIKIHSHHATKYWWCLATLRFYFFFWEEGVGFILNLFTFTAIPMLVRPKRDQKHRSRLEYALVWTPLVLSSVFLATGFQSFLLSPCIVSSNQLSYIVLGGLVSLIGSNSPRATKAMVLVGCLMSLVGSLTFQMLGILGILTALAGYLWMFIHFLSENIEIGREKRTTGSGSACAFSEQYSSYLRDEIYKHWKRRECIAQD